MMLMFSSLSSAGVYTPDLQVLQTKLRPYEDLTYAAELLRRARVDSGDEDKVESLFNDDMITA